MARDILTSSFIHDSHDDDNNVIDYALNKVDIHNCSGVRYATGIVFVLYFLCMCVHTYIYVFIYIYIYIHTNVTSIYIYSVIEH